MSAKKHTLKDRLEYEIAGGNNGNGGDLERRFFSHGFTKQELQKLGIEFIYDLLCTEALTHEMLMSHHILFQEYNKDLQIIAEAREAGFDVPVCGEAVDLIKHWFSEMEERLKQRADDELFNMDDEAVENEYKEQAAKLQEEIYITMKRGEKNAKKQGTFTLERFYEVKNAALAYGKPDIKKTQRERAAKYIIAQNAKGIKTNIKQGAYHFVSEITSERTSGGYKNTNALSTALYKHAKELGITAFRKRGA